MRLLLLDNFDSFTFTLADYLRQLGAEVVVRRNDVPLAELRVPDFDGVVLSPGPGTPAAAGVMPALIQAFTSGCPCWACAWATRRWASFLGPAWCRAARPMHGKVTDMRCDTTDPLFAGLPAMQPVTRYHSLVVSEPLPAGLCPWPAPPARRPSSWPCATARCRSTASSFTPKPCSPRTGWQFWPIGSVVVSLPKPLQLRLLFLVLSLVPLSQTPAPNQNENYAAATSTSTGMSMWTKARGRCCCCCTACLARSATGRT